jgi:hypothetical protein
MTVGANMQKERSGVGNQSVAFTSAFPWDGLTSSSARDATDRQIHPHYYFVTAETPGRPQWPDFTDALLGTVRQGCRLRVGQRGALPSRASRASTQSSSVIAQRRS